MRAIESCRTQVLGGHLDVCPDPACDFERPAYNSCRNRHCPKCQSLAQARFTALLDQLYRTDWVVYSKRPFAGPERVFRYLGRYTHRVAISNQRIQHIDQDAIRFATKNGGAVTLPHKVFTRRFLDHVLPHGFTKIRHFGLYASSNVHTKLPAARACLDGGSATPAPLPTLISP